MPYTHHLLTHTQTHYNLQFIIDTFQQALKNTYKNLAQKIFCAFSSANSKCSFSMVSFFLLILIGTCRIKGFGDIARCTNNRKTATGLRKLEFNE